MLSVALAAAVVACGGDNGSGPGITAKCGLLGSANVNVTGSATASVNGCGAYAVIPSASGPPTFDLILTGGTGDAPTHAINVGRQGPRPGNGTYNIGIADGQWSGTLNVDGSPDRFFILTGGTVTITTSNTGNLRGSVNMTATESSGTGTNTVTISGTFAAKCVDGQAYDC